MAKAFDLVRLVGEERRTGNTLAAVSRHWRKGKECFLFMSPHDDDAALGGGLMMQLAKAEKVPVHVIIVTNGSMGYCSKKEKDTISEIRQAETYRCYKKLGIPDENIHWLGYPDCSLALYQGRKRAEFDGAATIQRYTGLQNSFTYFLRKIRPTQVFAPTYSDLHPDHKYSFQELMISLFHASGAIWPELGKPLKQIPHIHEMAVYCDFPYQPKLQLQCSEAVFEKKLKSILVFESQKQIKVLVDSVRKGGRVEYFRPIDFQLYNPRKYKHMFADTSHFKTIAYH